jgi:hypothetical protein
METFYTYSIPFIRSGEAQTRVRQFKATNPGSAYAKCVKKFPGCTLLGAWGEGRLITGGRELCRLTYAPPSTIRIIAEPEPKAEQTHFGFFEQFSFDRKEQHHEATTSMPLTNSSHIAAETAGEKRCSGNVPGGVTRSPALSPLLLKRNGRVNQEKNK